MDRHKGGSGGAKREQPGGGARALRRTLSEAIGTQYDEGVHVAAVELYAAEDGVSSSGSPSTAVTVKDGQAKPAITSGRSQATTGFRRLWTSSNRCTRVRRKRVSEAISQATSPCQRQRFKCNASV